MDTSEVTLPDEDDRKLFVGGLPQVMNEMMPHTVKLRSIMHFFSVFTGEFTLKVLHIIVVHRTLNKTTSRLTSSLSGNWTTLTSRLTLPLADPGKALHLHFLDSTRLRPEVEMIILQGVCVRGVQDCGGFEGCGVCRGAYSKRQKGRAFF